MKKPKRSLDSALKRTNKPPKPMEPNQALAVLMKFRLIVNSAKHHFKWVEKQCGINGAQLSVRWRSIGHRGFALVS